MMQGYVRKLFQEKGFAFIEGEDQRDYFLHWSKVLRSSVPFRNMVENDRVSFDIEEGDQGPKALNVRVIRKADTNGGTDHDKRRLGPGESESDLQSTLHGIQASDSEERQAEEPEGQPFNSTHRQN